MVARQLLWLGIRHDTLFLDESRTLFGNIHITFQWYDSPERRLTTHFSIEMRTNTLDIGEA